MKNHAPYVLPIFLSLFGCEPDVATILNKINSEGSGYLYIYTAPALQAELKWHEHILDSLGTDTKSDLFTELKAHGQRSMEIERQWAAYAGEEVMIAVKRPPRPCPPPSSCFEELGFISYFTVNPENPVKIYLDGRELPVKNLAYDELTQIKTVQIPGKLSYKDGDLINIKLTVSYLDNDNNRKTEELDWKIPTSR